MEFSVSDPSDVTVRLSAYQSMINELQDLLIERDSEIALLKADATALKNQCFRLEARESEDSVRKHSSTTQDISQFTHDQITELQEMVEAMQAELQDKVSAHRGEVARLHGLLDSSNRVQEQQLEQLREAKRTKEAQQDQIAKLTQAVAEQGAAVPTGGTMQPQPSSAQDMLTGLSSKIDSIRSNGGVPSDQLQTDIAHVQQDLHDCTGVIRSHQQQMANQVLQSQVLVQHQAQQLAEKTKAIEALLQTQQQLLDGGEELERRLKDQGQRASQVPALDGGMPGLVHSALCEHCCSPRTMWHP